MDNLTHSLFGLTLARAGVGRGVPYATATLVLASNAPDGDIVTALFGGIDYLAAHRGPTHGPLGVVGLGLVTAGLVAAWARWRRRQREGGAGEMTLNVLARWAGLAMIGVVGHVLMDLPTVYGTRIFSPFSGTWFALDWMPIIDVVLWAALVGTLIAGRLTRQRVRWAIIGLALMAGDYTARAALHQRALGQGALFDAAGVRAPCATAPTLVEHRGDVETHAADPTACVAAAALPTFGSPFTWRIVRQSASGYEISDRSVLDRSSPLRSTRLRSDAGPDVARVRETRAGRVYVDFARFPIARVTARTPATTVRLFDARFIGLPTNDELDEARTSLSVTVTLPASP